MAYHLNSDKILFTQLGDEGVLYDIEKNEYVTLNETFFKILTGLESGKNREEICETLCSEYAISTADCLMEIDEVMSQLMQRGFLMNNL